MDGSPDVKSLILSGEVEATAAQFPTEIGEEAADILYQMLKGQTVPGSITVPVDLVREENLEAFDINRWQ